MNRADSAKAGDACRRSARSHTAPPVTMPPADFPRATTVPARDPAASVPARAAADPLSTYPGSKNGAGVFQKLISLMPPHGCYIEAFLGSGALMKRKRPALENIGIDLDESVISRHRERPGFRFECADALTWLAGREWRGDELVYCDPPYLGDVRRSAKPIYRHELLTEAAHRELLRLLRALPVKVLLSGYASELYDSELSGWSRFEFRAMTRRGPALEVVWFNYPEPTELHDYRFLGANFRDRLRLARKLKRWTSRLAALPALERNAILAALSAAAPEPTQRRGV